MATLTELRLPSIGYFRPAPGIVAKDALVPDKSSAGFCGPTASPSALGGAGSSNKAPRRARTGGHHTNAAVSSGRDGVGGIRRTSAAQQAATSQKRRLSHVVEVGGMVGDEPVSPPDLGIKYSSRLVRVSKDCSMTRPELGRGNSPDPVQFKKSDVGWLKNNLKFAAAEYQQQLDRCLDELSQYLVKLPSGSPIIELNSRSGDISVAIASRFPELWVQPTEGIGQISRSLFLVLEERVAQFGREHPRGPDGSRLMGPKIYDVYDSESWSTDRGRGDVGCIFAIDSLQYLSTSHVRSIVACSWSALRRGGIIFFAGKFASSGDFSEVCIMYDAAIQKFAKGLANDNPTARSQWGLHDLSTVRSMAEKIGFEFVDQEKIGEVDPDDYLTLVMRKPLKGMGAHSRLFASTKQKEQIQT